MTGTVREILVEAIVWWLHGRLHADPGPVLAGCSDEQRDGIYRIIGEEADHGCGQGYLEYVMEHLALHGAEYMNDDGSIVADRQPFATPGIPSRLLEFARGMYGSVNTPG